MDARWQSKAVVLLCGLHAFFGLIIRMITTEAKSNNVWTRTDGLHMIHFTHQATMNRQLLYRLKYSTWFTIL